MTDPPQFKVPSHPSKGTLEVWLVGVGGGVAGLDRGGIGKYTGIESVALLPGRGCGQISQEKIIIEQVISLPHLHHPPQE